MSIAPVATTTSITFSSNIIQNGDILVPTNLGPPRKMADKMERAVLLLNNSIFTGRMPRSGKLPVLFLLTGQKSGFSPRRGDSLHRFRSYFAGLTGTWVRLAVQNFTSIGAEGWECGPQTIKNFHFLVKSRPARATPLTDFQNF